MSTKRITLISSDGVSFVVREAVAHKSQKIADLVKDDCTNNNNNNVVVPLPNVKVRILAMVIEYCNKHVEGDPDEEAVKEWDTEFMKFNDQNKLHDLMMAAYDLKIEGLIRLTCKTVADKIPYQTEDEVRAFFKMNDDLKPEEKEQIRRENSWAFE
ncbi:PREDICTED: SKP1-like protein 1A [Camelina sativa]|uniref:SKP1-like protein n=1 Tax=Camelina sativa TaxID=90675 RepID=A0ABM0XFK1_CAMSA|nr:PREDICTED: SKP1-like protein 1A [Camelina sativa]